MGQPGRVERVGCRPVRGAKAPVPVVRDHRATGWRYGKAAVPVIAGPVLDAECQAAGVPGRCGSPMAAMVAVQNGVTRSRSAVVMETWSTASNA